MITPAIIARARVKFSAALLFAGLSYPALAHHSVAGFDRQHPAALSGTVERFVWSNPHSWIYMRVPDGAGGTQEWALEGASVAELSHSGWRPDSLAPGMKARIKIAPRRDGQPGGEFLNVLDVNGETFKLVK